MLDPKLEPVTRPADPALERLIPTDAPARPRAVAVLDGLLAGYAWADDPADPRGLLVVEDADGTVFAGGELTREGVVATLIGFATRSGDLIFGFAGDDDPLRELVPAEPYWRGGAVDFTDRVPAEDEAALVARPLADGARIVRIDTELLSRTEWYEDTLHAAGSLERWAASSIGFAVMIGDAMVAESVAGPRCRGLLEMGVVTRDAYRGRGYGTLVSRLVARACEEDGDRVWWNANSENLPSLAIARRLGFRTERPYEVVACRAPAGVA